MLSGLTALVSILDYWILAIFAPLALAILISGLDDLVVDLAWGWSWLRRKLRPAASLFPPGPQQLASAPKRRIAVLLPLWHEHEVIVRMLEHNLSVIRYPNYHFFAGCYPNDPETESALYSVANRYPNVHVCVCPHDGPTSKADCLNWTYQHILLFEEQAGQRFDILITHDAEDLIHPDEFAWINLYSSRYDFIQTPVLALKTPFWQMTHGVYCDEFAEYHSRDMNVRALLGGFVPSSGVGTGYRREALDRLAQASSNRIFEPQALTEDYENGLRLFRLDCSQAFLPIVVPPSGASDIVATREFFPQTWRSAVRQRTRWVTGISLQGWERFGWKGRPGEVYWLWRDRKGLVANPLSLLANAVFIYGLTTGLWSRLPATAVPLAIATLSLQVVRTGVRMGCTANIYGWGFAMGTPVRIVYANAINSAATFGAVTRYAAAKVQRKPLTWLKTAHAYPTRATLLGARRRIGDILVGSGYLEPQQLEAALATRPPGRRLGEHLVLLRHLQEETLYEALSLQQALPVVQLSPSDVDLKVARSLPKDVSREWRVLPFKIAGGHLHLAAPEAPSAKMTAALSRLTSLELRFHLVTPSSYDWLAASLL